MRKLKFKLSRNAYPLYGTSYTTCIGGCDPMFNELLNIKNENIKGVSQRNESGYYTMPDEPRSAIILNSTVVRSGSSNSRSGGNKTNLSNTSTSVGLVRSQSSNRNTTSRSNTTRVKKQTAPKSNTSNFDSSFVNPRSAENEPGRTWGHIDNDAVIMCNCHENAIQLTVRKEGPNQGTDDSLFPFVLFRYLQ